MKTSKRRESAVEILEARIAPAFVSSIVSLADLTGGNGSKLQGATAGDLTGSAVSAAGDVNGDGVDDFLVGSEGVGTAAVVFGTATGFPANETLDSGFLDGTEGFRIDVGRSVGAAGDVNGDGFDDVIVGSRLTGAAGAAFVIFGKASGFAAQVAVFDLDGTSGFRLIGGTSGDEAGTSVSGAGDVNRDGFDDVLVGAPGVAGGKGAAFLIYGKASGFAASLVLSGLTDEGVQLNGVSAGDGAGVAVSGAGDVNGDGRADVIIGAPRAEGGTKGAAYVVFGSTTLSATIGLDTLTGASGFKLQGVANNDATGGAVSGAGDVNGDGFADVIVGASKAQGGNNRGAAHVVFGKAGVFPNVIILDTLNGLNGFSVFGPFTEDFAGASVSGASDVNGDGIDDLLIGAPQNGTTVPDAGDTYLLFGRTGIFTAPNLGAPDVTNLVRLRGPASEVGAGTAASGAGDVNGDGFADLLISNPKAGGNTGASYLVLGGPSGFLMDPTITGGKTATFTDLDGDLVTVKVSKGTLTAANFQLLEKSPGSGRAQLLTLTLPDDANDTFHGADVSITAKRAGGGDGRVNVGFINAADIDLGKVTVSGDLGRIAAGDAVNDLALKSLTVGSLGLFGGRTGDTGIGLRSEVFGGMGPLKVAGDVDGAEFRVSRSTGATGGGNLASLSVSGSLIGHARANSGSFFVADRIGAVNVGGDLRSDGPFSAFVQGDVVGSVSVRGSLLGGDGFGSAAILAATSLGSVKIGGSQVGGRGTASASIASSGDIGSVSVAGDQIGSVANSAFINAVGNLAGVTIGGDARGGGEPASGGIFADGQMGPVVIKGDVLGTAAEPYTIRAGGPLTGAKSLALASVKIGGDLDHAQLLAGLTSGGAANGHAQIGAISVGGDWIASSAVAGVLPHAGATNQVGSFGNGDDVFITGGAATNPASIASVTIKGAARGTFETGDRYAIVAEQIGSVSVSGRKVALTKSTTADPANDLAAILVGPTPDFVVREVSRTTPAPAPTFTAIAAVNPAFPATIDLGTLDDANGITLSAVAAGDALGSSVSRAGDVNGDGFDDFLVGANRADEGGTDRGAAYVVFGTASGFPTLGALDGTNGFKMIGAVNNDYAGGRVAAAGDVNGDGFDDVLVSSAKATTGTNRGMVHVVFGRADFSGTGGSLDLGGLDGTEGFRIPGLANDDFLDRVATAGDVNGDGFDDVFLGASGADEGGDGRGASYLIFGGKSFALTAGQFDLATLDGVNGFKVPGLADNDVASRIGFLGDINGDGFDDLSVAVGKDMQVILGAESFAATGGSFDVAQLNGTNGFKVTNTATDPLAFIGGVGDVNGDGFADFAVRENLSSMNAGRVHVIFGRASFAATGGTLPVGTIDGTNGFQFAGLAAGDNLGRTFGAAGDMNGDGYADLFAASARAAGGGTQRGEVYVIFGRASFAANAGLLNLAALDGSNGFKVRGASDGFEIGRGGSGAGDVNGDGYADLLVGTDVPGSGAGEAYVIFGGPSGELLTPTFSDDSRTATWTDVDGDLVTLKVTQGTLDANDLVTAAKSATDSRAQLLVLNLDSEFEDADVSITAKRAGGGDGRVNVGSIDARGTDLGKVTVSGDLGRILAGDTVADPGLKSLTVGSLGLFGGRTGATSVPTGIAGAGVVSSISGAVGSLKIAGDLVGARFEVRHADGVSGGDLGTVTIGGSLIGGNTASSGAIDTQGTLGAVKVGGDLVGGAGSFSGSLFSSGDLGNVSIAGALRGAGGAFSAAIVSAGKLGNVTVVGSQLGGSGAESGAIDSDGSMGTVRIGGDQVGGSGSGSAIVYTRSTGADIAGVTIGGDARMGTDSFSGGIFAGGKLGPVAIKGDVIGTASNPYVIQGQGALTGTQSVAITSVKIGGDFQHALLRAGFDGQDNPTNGHAQIGAISVGGDWIASSVTAGLDSFPGAPDPSVTFGNGDDVFASGGPAGVIASIASITIKGRALGSLESGDRYGIVAEQIGSVTIGGVKLALTAGPDTAGFPIGPTPDFTVREVSRV